MTLVFQSWKDLANWTFSASLPQGKEMTTPNRPLLLILQTALNQLRVCLSGLPHLKDFLTLSELCLVSLDKTLMDPVIEESLQGCLDTLCLDELSSIPFTFPTEQIVIYQGLMKAALVFSKTAAIKPHQVAPIGSSPTTTTDLTLPVITCTSFMPATPSSSTPIAVAGPSQAGNLWDSDGEDPMELSPIQKLEKTSYYIYQKVKPITINSAPIELHFKSNMYYNFDSIDFFTCKW